MKILIAGKSGTGKDYLANLLVGKGLKLCKSYATRPPRYEGEDTHVFISQKEAEKFSDEEKFAKTVINGYAYFTTGEQAYENDIFTMDPKGIMDITSAMPEESFLLVYVYADEETRRNMAISRSDNPEKEGVIFDSRAEHEKELFGEFEENLFQERPVADNVKSFIVYNDYKDNTLEHATDIIIGNLNLREHIYQAIDWACDNGVLESDGKNVVVVHNDNSTHYVPRHIFAEYIVSDSEGFYRLFIQYLQR